MAVSLWVSDPAALEFLVLIHFAYPIFLIAIFLVAFTAHSVATASKDTTTTPTQLTGPGGKPLPRTKNQKAREKAQQEKRDYDFSPAKKLLFNLCSAGIIASLAANAGIVVAHVVWKREEQWWCGQHVVIYIVASFFVYSLVLISIVDTKPSPTVAHYVTWIFALVAELAMFAASLAFYTTKHREPSAEDPKGGKLRTGITRWELAEVLVDLLRICFLLALTFFYTIFVALWNRKQSAAKRQAAETESGSGSETTSLLNGGHTENRENGTANGSSKATANGTNYGSVAIDEPEAWVRPTKVPSKTWWEYLRGYSLFFPYLWPAKSLKLQFTFIFCFLLVVAQRVVNLYVPIQVGVITNDLTDGSGIVPWGAIWLFIALKLLQTPGLLSNLRSILWVPIGQYSYQELSTASFEHVHGLSLDFHLEKKTGEVLSALSKGNSINTFLEQITFSVLPMLVDLGIAIVYFMIAFDAYYALVVTIVTFAYLYVTIRLAQWRSEIRREMVNLSRQEDAVKNDSMMSYETVKYFNAEHYEFNRYRDAVRDFQKIEYKVLVSLNVMNVAQNTIFVMGLMITSFISAYQVTSGRQTVGMFTALLTYMAQLQGPLNFFGTFYRSIQSAMINSERLLELFKLKPTVVDDPSAKILETCQGEIRYNEVEFAYDPRKPALKGLDFVCKPGTTTALVGESGGGKSTVFRLLFRFYNATGGNIQIDGQDVRDLTIDSLRRHIGVVPQDTVLFNETLMYNLKYANPSATDEQVFEACRAASIHEKILAFSDGYQSRVGERGLKLSGGEKQRVAIARTILKDPRIILLDEATAALDSTTEQHIQDALTKLSQGRTTVVIAHRLSTITTADQILVLHAGRVAERGTHEQLLTLQGRYASMWRKQIHAQAIAEQAKVLSDRAEQLRSEARGGEDSASQSDDERSGGGMRRTISTASGLATPLNETETNGHGNGGHHGYHH